MLAPSENEGQDWHKKFIRKPPRLALRVSGGWNDPAVLFVDDALDTAGDTVSDVTQRMVELGLRPGDTWQLEVPHQNKVATLRRRTQVQIDAGVEAVIAIEPLDNSETKVEHVPLLKGLSS